MPRREMDQLDMPAAEKGVAGNKKGVGLLGHKSCESRIDLAPGAGVEDMGLQIR